MSPGAGSPDVDPWHVLEAVGQPAVVMDAGFLITHWNRAAERLYGWTPGEAIGRDARELFIPVGLPQDTVRIAAQLLRGQSWTGALTVQCKDGGWVRVVITDTPVLDAAGQVTGVVMVAASLNATAGPLLEHSNEAALVIGSDGLVLFASRAVTHLLGWPADQFIGQEILTLVHPEDRTAARALVRSSVGNTEQHCWELRAHRPDGTWLWVQASVTNLLREPGVRGLVVYLHDITERRAARATLQHAHDHDRLTGLPNRASLLTAIATFTPTGGADAASGALLLISVRSAGESWHRSVTDQVYRETAERLRAGASEVDLVGAVGDGEFAVLIPHLNTVSTALALAERIQMQLTQPITARGSTVRPVISIGLTMVGGRRRAHELLDEATVALAQGGGAGTGLVAVFGVAPTSSHPSGEGQLIRLTRGLAAGELHMHYQPVVTLADQQITGVEALLRWEHPDRGLLTAGAFLHTAEDHDLINDIGAFALSRACAQTASWAGSTLEVSVNISARQLADPHLADMVARALDTAALDPTRLILEITETALLRDLPQAQRTLAACRARGVRVSIDDFGTGFAGYGYLRDLPVDEIKIDKSFTDGLLTDAFSLAIVGGIIYLAHLLGLRTTAEGIETQQQAALLGDLGCDKGQGFLWSAAQPGHTAPTLSAASAPGALIPLQNRGALRRPPTLNERRSPASHIKPGGFTAAQILQFKIPQTPQV